MHLNLILITNMNEEIELITEETKDRMEKAIEHLEHELARLTSGKIKSGFA